MKCTLSLFCLLCSLALSGLTGCSTRMVNTTGTMRAPSPLISAKINFSSTLPNQIEMSKYVHVNASHQFTKTEQEIAFGQAKLLNQIFAKGFKSQFAVEAAKHGLIIKESGAEVPTLNVAVTSIKTRFVDDKCLADIKVSVDLVDTMGVSVWNFSALVGQASIYSKLSDDTFISFADELLASMKKDRVIER
jgi:hypothetical protein